MKALYPVLGKTVLVVLAILGILSVSHLNGYGYAAPYLAGGATLAILLVTMIWDAWKVGFHPWSWQVSWSVLTAFLAFVMGVLVGRGVNHHRIAQAKAFAEVAVPIIENYGKTHATVPEYLDEIPGMPPLPSLMSREWGTQEGSIRLDIVNPNDYSDNWAYLSEQHQWVRWSM